MPSVPDVARIRFSNAMRLFDEFVQASVKSPDAATLRGLERRFAERLQIQPSYWSQIKGGSRQIGERLARQFEVLCNKPPGWLDQVARSDGTDTSGLSASSGRTAIGASSLRPAEQTSSSPTDDDERFIVGLVLTYYRRHPQRARTRLLDLLGEVLTPSQEPSLPLPSQNSGAHTRSSRRASATMVDTAMTTGHESNEEQALWAQSLAGTAPLKRKS